MILFSILLLFTKSSSNFQAKVWVIFYYITEKVNKQETLDWSALILSSHNKL